MQDTDKHLPVAVYGIIKQYSTLSADFSFSACRAGCEKSAVVRGSLSAEAIINSADLGGNKLTESRTSSMIFRDG